MIAGTRASAATAVATRQGHTQEQATDDLRPGDRLSRPLGGLRTRLGDDQSVWAGNATPEPSRGVQRLAARLGRPHRRNTPARAATDPRSTFPLGRVTGEHEPKRPSWKCHACGEEWPCPPARERFLATVGIRDLAVMMGQMLHDALEDLPGTGPGELYDRFIVWTRRRPPTPQDSAPDTEGER